MNYKLNNQIKLSILLITWLIISTPLRADHHQSSDVNAMSDGTIEAAQLTVCTLNPGKTLDDVSEILPSIREVHKEIELNSFYGLMTPLFVSPKTTIDFIFADFAPFNQLSAAWDRFLVSESGAKLQSSLGEIANCNRSMLRYYHQYTKYSDDKSRVLSMNWCSKKEAVSMEDLMAKHRSLAESPNKPFLHWGIAVPAWGLRRGDTQGSFAHFIGYADMNAAMAGQSDIATKGGWKDRREYLGSFADCSGENLWKFDIANIPGS